MRYLLTIFIAFLCLTAIPGQNPVLMTCGDESVMIFDPENSKDTIPELIWEWNASTATDLPEAYRNQYFRTIDECKSVDGHTKILITSSSNGVAVIDRSSKKVLFRAVVGNAHSAEWLPADRIVVAGSTNKKGNRVALFDLNHSEKELFKDSLYSGHGVVWDAKKQLLYALGYQELRAYTLENWKSDHPKLRLKQTWKIPGKSGHDLAPYSKNDKFLIVTEHESTWLFNKNSGKFKPFKPLKDIHDIKSVTFHPTSNRLAYIKAETSWWSNRVYLADPLQWFSFPEVRLYKVRWLK